MKKRGGLLDNFIWVGFLGFLQYLDGWHPAMGYFGLFYLVFPVHFVWSVNRARKQRPDEPPVPVGRVLAYVLGLCMSMLNPITAVQILLHTGGQLLAMRRLGGKPPTPETKRAEGYRPPFRGKWTVAKGGNTRESSHSWEVLNQRYALDFYIMDEHGSSHRLAGARPEDFYAYDQPVVAAADGVVVAVKGGVRDFPSTRWGLIDMFTTDFRGNFVVIRHRPDEYSVTAHFRKGTVQVRPGDHVKQGQLLGQCGNSGHSTEPHIHFHVQDHPNFYLAAGVPVMFDGVFVQGSQPLIGFPEALP